MGAASLRRPGSSRWRGWRGVGERGRGRLKCLRLQSLAQVGGRGQGTLQGLLTVYIRGFLDVQARTSCSGYVTKRGRFSLHVRLSTGGGLGTEPFSGVLCPHGLLLPERQTGSRRVRGFWGWRVDAPGRWARPGEVARGPCSGRHVQCPFIGVSSPCSHLALRRADESPSLSRSGLAWQTTGCGHGRRGERRERGRTAAHLPFLLRQHASPQSANSAWPRARASQPPAGWHPSSGSLRGRCWRA